MRKVLIVSVIFLAAIFFISIEFSGYAFALDFGSKISEQTSMLLLGIVLIGVAVFWRKKLFKK